jgi:hypothetical protein
MSRADKNSTYKVVRTWELNAPKTRASEKHRSRFPEYSQKTNDHTGHEPVRNSAK